MKSRRSFFGVMLAVGLFGQQMSNELFIAACACDDGPYGFSFALRRTTTEPVGAVLADGRSVATENRGRTIAAAAPTPNKCANLRREIESVFMARPPDEVLT